MESVAISQYFLTVGPFITWEAACIKENFVRFFMLIILSHQSTSLSANICILFHGQI